MLPNRELIPLTRRQGEGGEHGAAHDASQKPLAPIGLWFTAVGRIMGALAVQCEQLSWGPIGLRRIMGAPSACGAALVARRVT